MIVAVQAQIQAQIDLGKTEPEVLNPRLTAPFDNQVPGGLDPVSVGGMSSADRFVSEVYRELASQH
jgi:hypothetical protein